jgi:hypothetical protein
MDYQQQYEQLKRENSFLLETIELLIQENHALQEELLKKESRNNLPPEEYLINVTSEHVRIGNFHFEHEYFLVIRDYQRPELGMVFPIGTILKVEKRNRKIAATYTKVWNEGEKRNCFLWVEGNQWKNREKSQALLKELHRLFHNYRFGPNDNIEELKSFVECTCTNPQDFCG